MIGDRIKQLRTEAKMTQPELASRLSITRSTIAAYENNTRQPSFQVLIRLAEIFHVTTDYLLIGNNNDLLDISGLSMEQRMIIVNLVKNFQETNEIIRFDTRKKKELVRKNRELTEQIKEPSHKKEE